MYFAMDGSHFTGTFSWYMVFYVIQVHFDGCTMLFYGLQVHLDRCTMLFYVLQVHLDGCTMLFYVLQVHLDGCTMLLLCFAGIFLLWFTLHRYIWLGVL